MIKAVIFDFGGVMAEEGFREGLKAIAIKRGLEPGAFFRLAEELIYETGYLTGKAGESDYWEAVRERAGISGSDSDLRREILSRFILRPGMVDAVKRLRGSGMTVALLSDQTDWLDEINERSPFSHLFDRVFNSFYLGKSKRDALIFRDVASALGLSLQEMLFVDDNEGHIRRASEQGLLTIHFRTVEETLRELRRLTGTSEHRG
jgi:putative hydrolase of the HAD superfamily